MWFLFNIFPKFHCYFFGGFARFHFFFIYVGVCVIDPDLENIPAPKKLFSKSLNIYTMIYSITTLRD